MKVSTARGGFEHIRDTVQGHPMLNLLAYCSRYWLRLGLGILSSMVTRVAQLMPPILVAAAIDRVIDVPGQPGLLAEIGLMPSEAVPAGAYDLRVDLLFWLAVMAAIAFLVRALTRFGARYLIQSTAQKIQRDLRNDTYEHLQNLSLEFFDNHESGGLMSILNNDVNRLEQFLNTELNQIVRVIMVTGTIGAVLFWVYPTMAVVALIPVPIIALASGGFLVWIDRQYRAIRAIVGRLNSRLANNLGGMPVIKSFVRESYEEDRVADQSQAYHDRHIHALLIRRGFFSFLRLTTGVVFVIILFFGGLDVIEGTVSVGVFTMFFLYIRRLYGPMRRIGRTANRYQLAKSSAERVFGLLGLEPTIASPPDGYNPREVRGDVEFDRVRFSYAGTDAVLPGLTLSVEAGETLGVAGPTGAGKSSLLKLIPRFYDVDDGRLLVDGVDVRDWDLTRLRRAVGIVGQNPYLFSGTVLENLLYGNRSLLEEYDPTSPDRLPAEIMDRIRDALEAAEAGRFVRDLPEGISTQIGERGVKLSGGQRQRLAIARVILKDPEVVVLDEATSDVDTETELLIQRSLDRLVRDRTAFVIAHRLSTIQDADRIVVLEKGRIVEQGTHEELIRMDGLYAGLWREQADGTGSSVRPTPSDPPSISS